MKIKNLLPLLAIWTFIVIPFQMNAHKPDQTYLYLRVYEERIEGTVEITVGDLNDALGLELDTEAYKPLNDDDEGKFPLPESIAEYLPEIQAYVLERVALSSPQFGEHPMRLTDPTILKLEMGTYVQTNFELDNVKEIPDALDIRYEILFDKDPIQTGQMVVGHNWKAGVFNNESMVSLIFSRKDTQQQLDLTDGSMWKGFIALIKLGMWHIYIGLDHILFIFALVLPAVVRRRDTPGELASTATWQPVDSFKDAFLYILKIVTLFTIAHSITLSLASLGFITVSSRVVESIIAFSIALAAFHNIRPLIKRGESFIAFAFGLFHGLGFASVLGEKGLGGEYMLPSLLGFNIGVEIGQVLIICAMFPVLFLLRKTSFYPKIIFYGSILLIVIAFYWVFERLFEIDLPVDDFLYKYWRKVMLKLGIWSL